LRDFAVDVALASPIRARCEEFGGPFRSINCREFVSGHAAVRSSPRLGRGIRLSAVGARIGSGARTVRCFGTRPRGSPWTGRLPRRTEGACSSRVVRRASLPPGELRHRLVGAIEAAGVEEEQELGESVDVMGTAEVLSLVADFDHGEPVGEFGGACEMGGVTPRWGSALT